MNLKFGKIEERGPDAIRKVNAHSIMSLASRNNLPTQASVVQAPFVSSSSLIDHVLLHTGGRAA